MAVRVLLVVLLLVGQAPAPICTCAAASVNADSQWGVEFETPMLIPHSHCQSHADAGNAGCEDEANHSPFHSDHDRDCPATNPRPAFHSASTNSVVSALIAASAAMDAHPITV